ncbi:MAG: hypothetical protein IT372_19420, partial [Polyangiaceae bacterium]|nr:hypothetical protein [Polyangiaceae bacterium]
MELALCAPADCEDGDPCTEDVCDAGGCVHTLKQRGSPCSDGDACTVNDVCDPTGACVGLPTDGSDGNPCTIDACDPATGVTNVPVAAGTWCTDGNACTRGDQCDGGGHCLGAPVAAGTACDDGNECTGSDQCDSGGACAGTALANGTACDDIPCQVELCSSGRCIRTGSYDPDGSACDYAACRDGETCSNGQCQGGTQLAAGTACPDGNACNGVETCNDAGACVAGDAILVGDGQPCTVDLCDPGTGALTHPVAAAGAPCSDGDLCNGDETCDGIGPGASSCLAGAAPVVDDGNPCTLDMC